MPLAVRFPDRPHGPCRRSARRRRLRVVQAPARSRARGRARPSMRLRATSQACDDSSTIARGSSPRGLSLVTITRSARRPAIAPICGRLPGSRSPPQPNTQISRPPSRMRRTQRGAAPAPARRACARSRRRRAASAPPPRRSMRPGGGVDARRARASASSERDVAREQHAEHAEQVLHIERAGERGASRSPCAPRRRRRESHARVVDRRRRSRRCRRSIGAVAKCTRWPSRARTRDQRAAERIVGVDDGRAQSRPREQARLRCAVRCHRAVIIEMIARQVREQRDVERDAVDAALIEPVRRDFHRDGRRAFVAPARKQPCSTLASGVVLADGCERTDEAVAERADDGDAPPAARRAPARSSARTTSCRSCR